MGASIARNPKLIPPALFIAAFAVYLIVKRAPPDAGKNGARPWRMIVRFTAIPIALGLMLSNACRLLSGNISSLGGPEVLGAFR